MTKPGGRLVVCEFSTPTFAPFRTVYTGYLTQALPKVARAVSRDSDAYVYLAESIRDWPDQRELGVTIKRAGWGSGVPQPVRRDRRAAPAATRPA